MLYSVEIHEIGQSPYDYDMDQGKVKWFPQNSAHLIIAGKQIITNKLKSPKMNCHEDNSNEQTKCLNKFYAKKLGCTLPWVEDKGAKCTGKDKFVEFKNLSMRVRKSDIKKEVPDEQNSQKEDPSEGVANTVIVGL